MIRIYLFLFFSIPAVLNAQETIKVSEDLRCQEVDAGVYLVTHFFPFGSNCLLVKLEDNKAMLIDTPHEKTGTRDLIDWAEDSLGIQEIIVIITGWHQDNLGGNQYLRSLGIDIYGPELTAELIDSRGGELKALILDQTVSNEDKRYFEAYKQLEFVPPNKTFPIEQGLFLEYGNESFEVFFPGESHTVDNTVVYLHSRKILFGGCMIYAERRTRPGYTGHANMDAWPSSLDNVSGKFKSAKLVIPGHGQVGGRELIGHTLEVIEEYSSSR